MGFRTSFFTLLLIALSAQTQAQEWANVARFQIDNAKIIAAKTPVKVVFMGNSITEAWPMADADFFNTSGFINRGISGQTTPQMLLRFKQDVIELHPKVVVILAGTNDIAGNTGPTTVHEIFGHIESMASLAAAAGIKVVICSVLPVFDYPWKPGLEPVQKIIDLNNKLKVFTVLKGHSYADYFSAMANDKSGLREDLGSDGVHPNKKGYGLMKPIVLQAIEKALSNK